MFWALGDRILRWTGLEGRSAPERFGLSIAFSYVTVSAGAFVLALVGSSEFGPTLGLFGVMLVLFPGSIRG